LKVFLPLSFPSVYLLLYCIPIQTVCLANRSPLPLITINYYCLCSTTASTLLLYLLDFCARHSISSYSSHSPSILLFVSAPLRPQIHYYLIIPSWPTKRVITRPPSPLQSLQSRNMLHTTPSKTKHTQFRLLRLLNLSLAAPA
jgi:hypothetical protein